MILTIFMTTIVSVSFWFIVQTLTVFLHLCYRYAICVNTTLMECRKLGQPEDLNNPSEASKHAPILGVQSVNFMYVIKPKLSRKRKAYRSGLEKTLAKEGRNMLIGYGNSFDTPRHVLQQQQVVSIDMVEEELNMQHCCQGMCLSDNGLRQCRFCGKCCRKCYNLTVA